MHAIVVLSVVQVQRKNTSHPSVKGTRTDETRKASSRAILFDLPTRPRRTAPGAQAAAAGLDRWLLLAAQSKHPGYGCPQGFSENSELTVTLSHPMWKMRNRRAEFDDSGRGVA